MKFEILSHKDILAVAVLKEGPVFEAIHTRGLPEFALTLEASARLLQLESKMPYLRVVAGGNTIIATEKTVRRRLQIVAGLVECGRAGEQTPAMLALNRHVFGTHAMEGAGVDATAEALLEAGFDPPADPRHFSAPLACNLLNVRAAPEHRPTGVGGPL